MFTNIPEPEKTNYIEIIQNLGGTVSDEKTFDLTATHLILRNPIKNEKLLSSIASGKWILHPDYLKESEVQKRFLPEIDFEWGGPGTCKYMQNIAPNSEKLAKCPIRWRKKLNGNKDMFGAFHNWKVVVFAEDKAKLSTYTKILEAGGAEIVPTSDADSALDTISHVFVDVKKKNGCKVDLTSFVSHNIKCLKPEYLAFYLTEDPLPDVDSFILAEAKELMDASASSSKRHAMSSATR
ncbi:DNA topoisomerase 2-binding protein 1-B, partial [Stegodyphus mimosarum]